MNTGLTDLQLDVLQEICNIGAGNAATSLSKFINKKVDMSVPCARIISYDSIYDKLEDRAVVAVVVRVLEGIQGNILVIFNEEIAKNLVKSLAGSNEDIFDEMGTSLMCEIGNIMSGTFLETITKFASFTEESLTLSVPALCYDMLTAILSTIFIESGQHEDFVLELDTEFTIEDDKKDCLFYFIPVPGSLDNILEKLKFN